MNRFTFYHKQSELLASKASLTLDTSESIRLYENAAELELTAFSCIDRKAIRTVGIIGISVIHLYMKANRPNTARLLAHHWLTSENLPLFAIDEFQSLTQIS